VTTQEALWATPDADRRSVLFEAFGRPSDRFSHELGPHIIGFLEGAETIEDGERLLRARPDTHTPCGGPCAWRTEAAFVFAVYACCKLWSSMTSCVTSPGRFGLTLLSNHWACCSRLSQISATVNPLPAAS
jgi:hypothetical protein